MKGAKGHHSSVYLLHEIESFNWMCWPHQATLTNKNERLVLLMPNVNEILILLGRMMLVSGHGKLFIHVDECIFPL